MENKPKIKLLRLFRWTDNTTDTKPNGWPITGIWLTQAIYKMGDKHQNHEMVCVMPDGNMYPHGHKLRVHTGIIEHCMTEVEIVEKK